MAAAVKKRLRIFAGPNGSGKSWIMFTWEHMLMRMN